MPLEPAQLSLSALQLLISVAGQPAPTSPQWRLHDHDGRAVHISLRDVGTGHAVFFEALPTAQQRGPCTWWLPLLDDASLARLQRELTGLHASPHAA